MALVWKGRGTSERERERERKWHSNMGPKRDTWFFLTFWPWKGGGTFERTKRWNSIVGPKTEWRHRQIQERLMEILGLHC